MNCMSGMKNCMLKIAWREKKKKNRDMDFTCSAKNLDLASSNSVADRMLENAKPLLSVILVIGSFESIARSLLMSLTPQ